MKDPAIQTVIKNCELLDLVVALKDTGMDISSAIKRNLSDKAQVQIGQLYLSEFIYSASSLDVSNARNKIGNVIEELQKSGRIKI